MQSLAELRPRAEDRGPAGRERRRLSARDPATSPPSARRTGASPTSRPSASAKATSRRCAPRARRPVGSTTRTASTCISRWARRWKTRAITAGSFEHYAKGNALHRAQNPYDAGPEHGAGPRTSRRSSRAISSPRAPGAGCPDAEPDLHRRHAALGLDAARADPGQPLGGGRHDGTARDDHHGPGAAGPRRRRRSRLLCRRPRRHGPGGPARTRRELPRAHARAPQNGPPALHRQDAEQLRARRR